MATTKKAAPAEVEYPDSDGMPMAESDLHRKIMNEVIDRLIARYAKRDDVYVTGNLLVYYVEGDPRVSLAPDCFVVFGVPSGDRRIYKVWEEGKFPTVVFEITSKTTEREDMGKKFEIYQDTWKVKELFLFDPTEDYLDPPMVGYRMSRGELKVIKPVGGRITSKELGVTLERDGTRLVLRDARTGRELLLPAQAEAEEARRKLRKAQKERELAEEARDTERAELDRLRVEVQALRTRRPPN
jgi:Uma2 family endonuclease